jgi:hypothetical protein
LTTPLLTITGEIHSPIAVGYQTEERNHFCAMVPMLARPPECSPAQVQIELQNFAGVDVDVRCEAVPGVVSIPLGEPRVIMAHPGWVMTATSPEDETFRWRYAYAYKTP